MAGKKAAGENSKKASGQARKAEAQQEKQAAKGRQAAAVEDEEWSKGSKDNSKKEAQAAKAAEAARKKAEKAALEAEELAALPSKPKGNSKKVEKKSKGLDLSQLDDPAASKADPALNATGIDNALDALDIAHDTNESVDRHPERRFKAAYAQFEERRLEEMSGEKGLRRNQKVAQIRKEFENHPDNPFNQVAGRYDMTKEELRDIAKMEKEKKEARLVGTS